MPKHIKFYEECNLVVKVFTESMTNKLLFNGVLDSRNDKNLKPGFLELADCRKITDTSNLTTDGILTASQLELENTKYVGGKLVIVADRPHLRGLAMQYSLYAERSRDAVNIVNTVEEAISWLGLDHLTGQILKDIDELSSL